MVRAYSHQHLAEAPRGWRVRSKRAGDHVLRVAFPPGRRRRGAGKLLEILHPKQNPSCEEGSCDVGRNPSELLIFGNPGWLDPKDKLWGHFSWAGGSDRSEFRSAREARAYAKRLAKETGKSIHYRGPKNKPLVVRNPRGRNAGGIGNHKPGCKCPFCERVRAKASDRADKDRVREQTIRSHTARKGGLAHAKGTRRRNQSDTTEAIRLFQSFHGRDPKEIAEKQESAAMRLEYTALGDLEYLIVKPEGGGAVQINFEGDGVKLASSPNGKQLYLIGGTQNLSSMLDKFTDDPEKDFIDLGEGREVQYLARKIHGDFQPVSWYHKFGEENGALPRLMYDKLKRRIFFVGGEYYIDTSNAVSPGIEN